MKGKDILTLIVKLEALEGSIKSAQKGEEVPIPAIKGLNLGKKGTLKNAVFVVD